MYCLEGFYVPLELFEIARPMQIVVVGKEHKVVDRKLNVIICYN